MEDGKSKEASEINNGINEEEKNPNNEFINQKKEEEKIESNNEVNQKKEEEEKIESNNEEIIESNNEVNQKKESSQDINNNTLKEKINSFSNNEKMKRHRRGKKDTEEERKYKCPDCDKCYLSPPALVTHRKTKHGYNTEADKKSRGRPKREDQQETCYQNALLKYNNFFKDESRKIDDNEEKVNLDTVKQNILNFFGQYKNKLFKDIDNIENYPFYQLIINNWNNKNHDFPIECFSDNIRNDNINTSNKYNSPPLEQIFFLYLKELSNKTNKTYFLLVNQFILLFRECINSIKKDQVKEELKTDKAKEYSQIFSAEGIPESCNDFFLEFMQPNNYYGLTEKELIEIAQHFCFWLYLNKYTHSYLTLL